MTEDEEEAGYVLTCQMTPQVGLRDQHPGHVGHGQGRRVRARRGDHGDRPRVRHDARLRDHGWTTAAALGFLPGQYVNIVGAGHRPDPVVLVQLGPAAPTRWRSCSATPRRARCRPTCGSGRRWATASSSHGPLGSFYLREVKRPLLFLAGGTGLAPFLSMLEKIGADGADQPVHLIFGVTNDADLVKVDELEQYAEAAAELHLHLLRGRRGAARTRTRATSPATSSREHLNGGDVDVYLCGPPPMVDAVRKLLEGAGHRAAELLLREVLRHRPGRRDRLDAAQGRSTSTRRSTPGWRSSSERRS